MKLNTMRLQEELLRNGLSQKELAEKIGVTEVSVSRYVHGSRMPREPVLHRMAMVLGVTAGYLKGVPDIEYPDNTYALTSVYVRTYADKWTNRQKAELISEILKTIG